ncbi:MAG: peptidoglycan-binding protein, partial [Patescibacteria group bacterium]
QVEILQTLLASDSDIYPEGLITGYFGALTSSAVRRFQARHGIEQLGIVGPKTREKLKELLKEHPIAFEDEDDDEDEDEDSDSRGRRAICTITPPGHLIAPGWLRKMGGVRPLVPECQVLPSGIAKKLPGGTGTTTPPAPPPADTTAPVITGVSASNIASTSAIIGWTTNEAANSKVYYGTSTPLNLASASTVSNSALVTSHSLSLTGLTASTTHYYAVESKDAAANTATSSQQSFMTLP